LKQKGALIEPQFALAVFTGVALEAAFDENRPDLVLEEIIARALRVLAHGGK
jgi:hypothetical protein